VATNSQGTVSGSIQSFTSAALSAAPSLGAALAGNFTIQNTTQAGATLQVSVNPNGVATGVYFEYGPTAQYGLDSAAVAAGNGSAATDVQATITGLSPGAVVHFRPVAISSAGLTEGNDQMFTVPSLGPQAQNDVAFTGGKQPVNIAVLANDSAGLTGSVTIQSAGPASAGTVTINANGTLTYTPAKNFSGSDSFTYVITDGAGRTSTATVTIRDLFAAGAGTYSALVGTAASSFKEAGSILITATAGGAFTGALRAGGVAYHLQGKLQDDGSYTKILGNRGQSAIALSFQLTPGSAQLIGGISDGLNTNAFTANRSNYNQKSNPAPQAGSYTLLLPPANDGVALAGYGYGFATMKVSAAGTAVLAGRFGDGQPFAASAVLDGGGNLPLYATPASAKVKESLCGSVVFRFLTGQSDCDGLVGVARTFVRTSVQGTDFVFSCPLAGSLYARPAPGERILALANSTANGTFTAGPGPYASAPAPLAITLSASDKVTAPAKSGLTMIIAPASGLIHGVFDNGSHRAISYQGIVFQRQGFAAGAFTANKVSDFIRLDPAR
jgi:hypothetical protein